MFPTLLLLVGLSRCQLPGQESRILNSGGSTRNQPPVLMRGGPTSGDLRNLQVQYDHFFNAPSSSFAQVFEDTPVGTTVYTLIGQVPPPPPCSSTVKT